MRTLLVLMGRDPDDFDHVTDRAGHDLRYAIDPSALQRRTRLAPRAHRLRGGPARDHRLVPRQRILVGPIERRRSRQPTRSGGSDVEVRELSVPGAWEITPTAARRRSRRVLRMVHRPRRSGVRRTPVRPATSQLLGVGGRGAARTALRAAAPEPGQVRDLRARRRVRRGRRHPRRLTDIRAVGLGGARRPQPPVDIPRPRAWRTVSLRCTTIRR